MQPENPQAALAREWFEKAEHDALAAEQLAPTEALSDVVAFHCQQAAEKALKAYLTWCNQPFRRVHDLEELVNTCAALDSAFLSLLPAAESLSPYAITLRYPTGAAALTAPEVDEARRLMHEVMSFVRDRLPPQASP